MRKGYTNMRPQLAVALDVPAASAISGIVESLPSEVEWYKIGLELFTSEGPAALDYLRSHDKSIFLDLKLHDIPRTVARAIGSIGQHGVAMLTVHANGGPDMLSAAAEAAANCSGTPPKVVAVTTLTSLNQNDLTSLGIQRDLAEHTFALGEMAMSSGVDGLVCSVHEVESFRKRLGHSAILVTPGIRMAGDDVGDQKRVATPAMAVSGGSSMLVVGRSILQADDPSAAAIEIMKQMDEAEINTQ